MKGLGQFRQFDWAGFSAGKAYQVVGVSDWLDRDTGKRLGKRVDVVITSDNTQYEHRNGEQFTNLYQRLTFKIEGSAAVDVAIGDIVIPVDAVAINSRLYAKASRPFPPSKPCRKPRCKICIIDPMLPGSALLRFTSGWR